MSDALGALAALRGSFDVVDAEVEVLAHALAAHAAAHAAAPAWGYAGRCLAVAAGALTGAAAVALLCGHGGFRGGMLWRNMLSSRK